MNFVIMGDSQQYFGARKLWSKLSKSSDVIVDLVNIKTKKVLKKNITLHQGNSEEDFDKAVWSLDTSKENIRPILKKILQGNKNDLQNVHR